MNTVTLDFETTTKNKGHPFTPDNYVVSYSIKINNGKTTFHYYTDLDFLTVLRTAISRCNLFVGFNIKFDLHWLYRLGITLPDGIDVFDCSLAEYVITGQEATMVSLDEVLASYGLPPKQDKVKEYWSLGIDTPDIPYHILEEYGNTDVDNTYNLFLTQCDITNEKQHKLILLSGRDLLTLLSAEQAGIKFDREKCLKVRQRFCDELTALREELQAALPPLPRQVQFNWDSGDQLSAFLYGGTVEFSWREEEEATYKSGPKKGLTYLKGSWFTHTENFPQRFKPLPNTLVKKCTVPGYSGTMFYQVDDPTLKQLKSRKNEDKRILEILDSLAKKGQVVKMFDTFLKHFELLEWEDNLVHGQFNQNVARTGRLSASKPNMQNTPPELDELLISRYDL